MENEALRKCGRSDMIIDSVEFFFKLKKNSVIEKQRIGKYHHMHYFL